MPFSTRSKLGDATNQSMSAVDEKLCEETRTGSTFPRSWNTATFLTFFYPPRVSWWPNRESARFRADSRTGAGFVEAGGGREERTVTFDFNDESRGYDGIINQPVSSTVDPRGYNISNFIPSRSSRIRIDIDYLTNFFSTVPRFHIARGAQVLPSPLLSLFSSPSF